MVCSGLGRSSSGALVGGAFAVLAIAVGLSAAINLRCLENFDTGALKIKKFNGAAL